MALFKVSKGLKANLPSAKTEGYCWYTTDDSLFYIDYKDENGSLQRKALNAKDAETLTGASLSTILNSSDVEIPTSKAVLNALNAKLDKADAGSDWNQNDETKPDYVKNRPFYTGDTVEMVMLPETTITIRAGYENRISSSFPYSFELGKTYVITFDGVDTEYTAYEAEGFVVIGYDYPSLSAGSGYVVMAANGLAVITTMDTSLNGSHTIAIKGRTQEIIKIDEKYLPDDLTSEISTLSSDVSTLSSDVSTLSSDVNKKMDKTNPTGSGSFSLNRSDDTIIGENSFAEGERTTASGKYSHAEGYLTTASGYASHAEGSIATALGLCTHAEGASSRAYSSCVTAENPTDEDIITAWKTNKFSIAKGAHSHIEGENNLALGVNSHAEGYQTNASGDSSHAEGYETIASTDRAHAEGYQTIASGDSSHTEGYETIASSDFQHVQGKFNIEDSSNTYAHIVGNGWGSHRSNAHTLDWSGNAWYAGKVSIGTTSNVPAPTADNDLVPKKYIDDMFGMSELSLRASNWTGTESPYSQVVEVSGVTANSKVDLNPTGEQLNSLAINRTILNTANDNGTVTVYAVGNKPMEDYTMQVTITEV